MLATKVGRPDQADALSFDPLVEGHAKASRHAASLRRESGMAEARTRILAQVVGHVQGVGFRYSCLLAARAAGVSGWVRNRSDGSVEAAFEGSPAAVDAMTSWMHHGPQGAHVTAVELADQSPEGASGFEIR
jgi:acylphosphatase